MRRTVVWIMFLTLLRDRGALAMSFVLPPAIFLIFAAVFANVGSDKLSLTVAIANEVGTAETARITAELAKSPRFRIVGGDRLKAADVRRLVLRGDADVGVVFRRDALPFDRLSAEGTPPVLVIADPTRVVAMQVLTAEIRAVYHSTLMRSALGNLVDFVARWIVDLTPDQRSRAAEAIRRAAAESGERQAFPPFERLFQTENAQASGAGDPIAYYAGAIAVLFLLLAAVNGGTTLLEEREAGIIDRIASSPGGIGVFVDGKLVFITLLGTVQVTSIFAVAWIAHGVGLDGRYLAWAIVTVAAAWSAAGMALLLAAACRSHRQVTNLGNFIVLVLSAIGGSMVPRFLMPGWLRDLGWLTPNTWALEAYDGIVRRGESLQSVALPVAILAATGLIGWLGARILSRRVGRLS